VIDRSKHIRFALVELILDDTATNFELTEFRVIDVNIAPDWRKPNYTVHCVIKVSHRDLTQFQSVRFGHLLHVVKLHFKQ
jgi:hypothetical protein